MPFPDQTLTTTKGDSFAFEIDLVANPGDAAPDLTDATARWTLAESWFDGARSFVTKTSGAGVFINNDSGWKVIVALDPVDTANVPAGLMYHECRVVLSDGSISHIASGDFNLLASIS
jgi:hypothetical protein